jgi:hypothetical protein
MAARKGWSAKLSRPIGLRDGTTLKTLADLRRFVLAEPEHIQHRSSWQRVAELLIDAAESGGDIETLTTVTERVLFIEARLRLQ